MTATQFIQMFALCARSGHTQTATAVLKGIYVQQMREWRLIEQSVSAPSLDIKLCGDVGIKPVDVAAERKEEGNTSRIVRFAVNVGGDPEDEEETKTMGDAVHRDDGGDD